MYDRDVDRKYYTLQEPPDSPSSTQGSNLLHLPRIRTPYAHNLIPNIKNRNNIHQPRRPKNHRPLRRVSRTHNRSPTLAIWILRNQRLRIVPKRIIPDCNPQARYFAEGRDVAGHRTVVGIGLGIPELIEGVGNGVREDIG